MNYRVVAISAVAYWVCAFGTWGVFRLVNEWRPFGWDVALTGFVTLVGVQLIVARYGRVSLGRRRRERRGFEVLPPSDDRQP